MSTLVLAIASLVAPGTHAQSTTPPSTTALTSGGRVWTYRADSYLPQLALGDRGGQVMVLTDDDELLLVSSFDANPPAPVWRSPDVHSSYPFLVAAADRDVYLFGDYRDDPNTIPDALTLQKYRSGSSIPEWRYSFSPPQIVVNLSYDVSRDGETIVSYFDNWWTMEMEIRVHDPATGTPVRTIVFPYVKTPGFEIDLSPDGSVAAAAVTDYNSCEVYELGTGLHLATVQGVVASRQALSEHGRVLATCQYPYPPDGWHVRVYRRIPGGYALAFEIHTIYEIQPRDIAVSDDGSTLVVAWSIAGTPESSIVRAYDVATGTMTMEHVDASPAGDIRPSDLAISADGSRFVVGLFRRGSGSVPELAVYSRDSSQPVREHPALGSVFEVEISPDGKRYAAARALDNPSYVFSPCVIELYEFGGEDLVARGSPEIGETITFELHGTPGSRAALLRSSALAPTPIDVPGVGTLYLDPATLTSTSIGVVPPSGIATYSTVLARDPAMIGRTLWFQGLTSRPRHLTTDFVQLTVLP